MLMYTGLIDYLLEGHNQHADQHFHITVSHVCLDWVDVHFMHSAQLCIAFSFLFTFFSFSSAQFPFQRTIKVCQSMSIILPYFMFYMDPQS